MQESEEDLLTLEQAEEFIREVYEKNGIILGIDGFEDEDTYVYTEVPEQTKEANLRSSYDCLLRLLQLGCRLFSLTCNL